MTGVVDGVVSSNVIAELLKRPVVEVEAILDKYNPLLKFIETSSYHDVDQVCHSLQQNNNLIDDNIQHSPLILAYNLFQPSDNAPIEFLVTCAAIPPSFRGKLLFLVNYFSPQFFYTLFNNTANSHMIKATIGTLLDDFFHTVLPNLYTNLDFDINNNYYKNLPNPSPCCVIDIDVNNNNNDNHQTLSFIDPSAFYKVFREKLDSMGDVCAVVSCDDDVDEQNDNNNNNMPFQCTVAEYSSIKKLLTMLFLPRTMADLFTAGVVDSGKKRLVGLEKQQQPTNNTLSEHKLKQEILDPIMPPLLPYSIQQRYLSPLSSLLLTKDVLFAFYFFLLHQMLYTESVTFGFCHTFIVQSFLWGDDQIGLNYLQTRPFLLKSRLIQRFFAAQKITLPSSTLQQYQQQGGFPLFWALCLASTTPTLRYPSVFDNMNSTPEFTHVLQAYLLYDNRHVNYKIENNLDKNADSGYTYFVNYMMHNQIKPVGLENDNNNNNNEIQLDDNNNNNLVGWKIAKDFVGDILDCVLYNNVLLHRDPNRAYIPGIWEYKHIVSHRPIFNPIQAQNHLKDTVGYLKVQTGLYRVDECN